MALAAQFDPPPGPAPPTSVHPQETTGSPLSYSSYRKSQLIPVQAEYDATSRAYNSIDRRDRRFRNAQLGSCRLDAWLAVQKETRRVIVLSQSCRLRWCPLCSQNKSHHIAEGVTAWVRQYSHPKILTLTLKHTEDSLDLQITRLYACFRTLRKQKYYRTAIHGGIWFFQVKWIQESSSWHPHLHCLLDSEFIPHEYLKSTWKAVTGDSDIIDIRVIRQAKTAAEYVARYAARPAQLRNMPDDKAVECVDALHSRRLCGKWGTASEATLTPGPAYSRESLIPVMRYENSLKFSLTDEFARVILSAYMSREPVPLQWYISQLEDFAESPPLEPIHLAEPPPQLLLPYGARK